MMGPERGGRLERGEGAVRREGEEEGGERDEGRGVRGEGRAKREECREDRGEGRGVKGERRDERGDRTEERGGRRLACCRPQHCPSADKIDDSHVFKYCPEVRVVQNHFKSAGNGEW